MPTYQNNSNKVGNISTLTLQPQQIGQSYEYFTAADLAAVGWVQTSTTPSYNQIVYSVVLSGNGSYNIPQTLKGNYQITFFCASGSAEILLNQIGVGRYIVAGEKFSMDCSTRIIDSLSWVISSGSVSFTVEAV